MGSYRNDEDKCVRVNIYVKCDKNERYHEQSWEKHDYKKEDSCVEVNVYTQCGKDGWRQERGPSNDDSCVDVNVYTECDKKRPYRCERDF
jgi:hypothetical protein